jgi:hypothetical protein
MNFFKQIDLYYIITLLFLLLSANASFLAYSDISWVLALASMIIIATSKKLLLVKDLRKIGVFVLVYVVFVFIRNFALNGLTVEYFVSDVLFIFKFVLTAFIYCTILKEKVAAYLIKVMMHLTILSFFFYSIQLIGFGEYIFKFSKFLNLKAGAEFADYTNFLIFTYIRGMHEYRNAGFVWEPGSFGCFLIIILTLHFFLNNFTFDKKAIILVIAILTTLSTTDYLALLVLLFCRYRIKVPKINFGAIFLVLISIVIIIYLPFLGDKITDTYKQDMSDLNRLRSLEVFYRHIHTQIPLNRFSSMAYLYNTFGIKLILGVSNKYEDIINKFYSLNISNGIFDFFARFGLVSFVYYVYKYAKFCASYVSRFEYVIYLVIVFLLLGFGEPILTLPLVLIFLFIDSKQVNLFKNIKMKKSALDGFTLAQKKVV